MSTTAYVSLRRYVESMWPKSLLDPPPLEAFERIWIEPLEMVREPSLAVNTGLLFETELAVGIPGLDALKLVFAPGGSHTAFRFRFESEPVPTVRIIDVPICLRLDASLLKPARRLHADLPDEPDTFEPDPAADHMDITLAKVTISMDMDGNFGISGGVSIDLPPCFIGSTGIVIEAKDIRLFLDANSPPPGKPAGWRGIHIAKAGLYLPGELAGMVGQLELTDGYIGNGGFSGSVSAVWGSPLSAQLFGMGLSLSKAEISFKQNALTASMITGRMTLPFFNAPVDVELGIGDGGVTVKLANAAGGLAAISNSVLSMKLDSLGFRLEDGKFTAMLSGEVRPTFGAPALDWPSFKVEELAVDSDGNVRLEGGWLNLREQYAFNLYGFRLEITKLGFGKSDDGGSWIGFSGGLKLVDGLPAGASVEGLRVTWYDDGSGRPPGISMNGVGVELEIPGTLQFKGAVSYRKLKEAGNDINRFDGDIRVKLPSLGLELDATIVVGSTNGYNFFALYLGAELPAGIPLWSTGLALYGLSGLFAYQMEPNRKPEEEWYEHWYKRTPAGIEKLKEKWKNNQDSLALGAGVTIGTVADNGFTFSGKMLLVIVFPGPIILIEGKANLLQDRAKLSDDPTFRALAVIDNRAGMLEVGLDARYKYGIGGELIDIRGGAEAYFNFQDASAWHLYLGEKEPRDKRIRAELFKLFEANAYFMLDARSLAMGAWIGYDESWKFGPLKLVVEAWLEGNAAISFRPAHFHGDVWLHGKLELSAFGIGLGISADAKLSADVFDPFHLLGELHTSLELPWPLPDLSADVKLEWGPEPKEPALPKPLQEAALEHFKVTAGWPVPFMDEGVEPNPAAIPVVPLDVRPHLTFSRSVNDDAFAGVNPQPVPWETVGDPDKGEGPMKARYALNSIALQRKNGAAWETVAQTTAGAPSGAEKLWGSWAPVPQLPSGDGAFTAQTKLWLWSRSPFNYSRHTNGAWEEWFTEKYADYPCIPPVPSERACLDFERQPANAVLVSPWTSPQPGSFTLSWMAPAKQSVVTVASAVAGMRNALVFPSRAPSGPMQSVRNVVSIALPKPVDRVELVVTDMEGVTATAFDGSGKAYGPYNGGAASNPRLELTGLGIVRVELTGGSQIYLFRICAGEEGDRAEVIRRQAMTDHMVSETERWSQSGEVLLPNSIYRLKVIASVQAEGLGELSSIKRVEEQKKYVYFRTEGPPGLAKLSIPAGQSPDGFVSGLDDLKRYVAQTVPPTVPGEGEKPMLPRPVYRAYDVGVAFNEDYVDLMYRIDRRDLGLYLYDNNNRPVRDAEGRLVSLSNPWGRSDQLNLSRSEIRHLKLVNQSKCVSIDEDPILRSVTLSAASHVLDADTVYQAKLVPLLWHDDFGDWPAGTAVSGPAGTLGRWKVLDEGQYAGPSLWEVRENAAEGSRWIESLTEIWGGNLLRSDPNKPGTMLLLGGNPNLPASHRDQPSRWTDYKFSVYLRSMDDDAVGVVFRFRDHKHHYRFVMDRERKYRRFVRVFGGVHTILAEDDYVYVPDRDELITIEAVGESLKVYMNGKLVFAVTDSSNDAGGIGLYAWGNLGTRFSDVRVEDYRIDAPAVYRFSFTTSAFANFVHHLQSYQDAIWPVAAESITDLTWAAYEAEASSPQAVPSDAEYRSYEALIEELADAIGQSPSGRVEIERIESEGKVRALLLRSPEPVDWSRTGLQVGLAGLKMPAPYVRPGEIKVIGAVSGSSKPSDEHVTLLLREPYDLSNLIIEYACPPGPIAIPADDGPLLLDDFTDRESGLLFVEDFGPNALDHYTIVDEGRSHGPSDWRIASGHLVQLRNLYGGSGGDKDPVKPGTLAITGSAAWSDIRVRAALRSGDDDAIGLVFRYRDPNHHYRFSMDRDRRYRRLIKKVGGDVTVLWEDKVSYQVGVRYELVIDMFGDLLIGYLNRELLFCLRDEELSFGQIGFYCWANLDAHFEALSVEALANSPLLWHAFMDDDVLEGFEISDAPYAYEGPSNWQAVSGAIVQDSNIYGFNEDIVQPGTIAIGGPQEWRDIVLSVRVRSKDNDAIGVLFRYEDPDRYYIFVMDKERSFRKLVRRVAGVETVLWQDKVRYVRNHSYELTITMNGSELVGHLDGLPLFSVNDGAIGQGRIGLYTRANIAASFERIVVTESVRRVGQWTIRDEGELNAPSVWMLSDGSLEQRSGIYGSVMPAAPGTYAVSGRSDWRDYRLQVQARSDGNGAIGVLFRYRDPDNYYRLSFDQMRAFRRLIRMKDGAASVLWEASGSYVQGIPFTITVDAVGNRLTGYVDGNRLFELTDGTHGSGQVGLYSSQNNGARFERIEVVQPPLSAKTLFRDRFRTGDMAGWTFPNLGSVWGTASWGTADGELRQTGTIIGLDAKPALSGAAAILPGTPKADLIIKATLRSMNGGIMGLLFRFAGPGDYYGFVMDQGARYRRLVKRQAGITTVLWEDRNSYQLGKTYELTIIAIGSELRGFIDDVPAFVVNDKDIPSGSIGLFCSGGTDIRFSRVELYPIELAFSDWLLTDSFAALVPGRWTFSTDPEAEGEGSWSCSGEELLQTGTVSTPAADPNERGTYALAGDAGWTDYRISAVLRTEANGAIGVIFRYKNENNFYKFSSMPGGASMVVKRMNGVETYLWGEGSSITKGQRHLFTVDLDGPVITGYLDGYLLFRIEDGDIPSGRIGLYASGDPGALFDEVRVAAPAWAFYYRFGREKRYAAGTQIRVRSGRIPDAAESGMQHRSAAVLDDAGTIRFRNGGVTVRLRQEGNTGIRHNRKFPSDALFGNTPAKVIRNRDGTGVFIFVPDAGSYRLTWTYRRDNTSIDPSSQVLREAGDASPERTVLDIPGYTM